MALEVTIQEYKWVILTLLLTMFVCFALQEIMERGFGMDPKITKASDIQKQSHGHSNPLKHYKMNQRLTKPLDIKGQYRIQTRSTVYFIRSLYHILLFFTSLYVFFRYPAWFRDHFIYLKADSVNFMPYLHISSSLIAFYSWEVIANRYGKITWSVLVHHWFAAGIAAAILLGIYTPFATWYGFCLVSMDFPVFFTLGFRAQFSNKYPVFTRKGFIFSFYWWIFIIILNLSGQLYIVFNSLINYYNESISVSFIIIMLFCICAWLYNDMKLLRSLHDFSTHNYEDAMSAIHDIEREKSKKTLKNTHNYEDKRTLSGNVDGRSPMGVIHDINTSKKLESADDDNEDNNKTPSPHSHSADLTKKASINSVDVADLIQIQKEEIPKMTDQQSTRL